MGIYDRDYTREDSSYGYRHAPQMRMAFPRITPAVKWLLIINIGLHLVKVFFLRTPVNEVPPLESLFAVFPTSVPQALQLWRLITYQFLHWNGWHLFANMLALFFLGPVLERNWGGKKFIVFYLTCGAVGGLFYLLLVAVKFLSVLPMVGASGAILGMLAACAILFPQFVVFILLFPIPIRVAAVGFTLLYVINLAAKGSNAGGDAAHLAGMATGAIYVFS
ncbi:MAG: rhomboid family intramembrane serine protease, partial [Planctomycetota bacterium]